MHGIRIAGDPAEVRNHALIYLDPGRAADLLPLGETGEVDGFATCIGHGGPFPRQKMSLASVSFSVNTQRSSAIDCRDGPTGTTDSWITRAPAPRPASSFAGNCRPRAA